MRYRRHRAGLALATSAIAYATAADASETVTYAYDSLGRLVRVERSGTVNNGVNAQYSYDSADNRTNVTVNLAGTPPPPPAPPPPPSPPASDTPPTAVTDTVSIARCVAGSFNVVANDADAQGDYPLTLVSIMGGAVQQGYASVGSSTSVAWAKVPMWGNYALTYTVRDSRGAESSGSLNVTVTGTGTTPCP